MDDASGIGIAAPQIGISRRVLIYDLTASGGCGAVVVNPTVVETGGSVVLPEGCLSVPGVRFEVERAAEIHLRGRDLKGGEIDVDLGGWEARVVLHELDHLDGVLFTERVDDDQIAQAAKVLERIRSRS
jgi:peptide deformylase